MQIFQKLKKKLIMMLSPNYENSTADYTSYKFFNKLSKIGLISFYFFYVLLGTYNLLS